MQNYLLDWDIQITEIKKGAEFATQGFDIYIFEHMMPTSLPTDGIVLLADPETVPSGAGFLLESIRDISCRMQALESQFSIQSDDDLIEACIYEMEALRAQYRFLLRRAREAGITGVSAVPLWGE